ncbi:TPA: hypothetical protein ACOTG0_002065 [Clostridium perfringens]|nr:hypothetical protein phiCPD_00069 [Clostridium phage phiCp-D]
MGGKRWSKKEIDYLNSMWGRYNLTTLAKKLNRTVEAVKVKSERLGLGGGLKAQDAITKADIKRICGITDYKVEKWISVYGLKCTNKVVTEKRSFCLIKTKDFWKFAKNNNELIDFSKIEKNILGVEPEWVDEFRKRDFKMKRKVYRRKWSATEEKEAIRLYRKGFSYKEIGKRLDRPYYGVQCKLTRLGYKSRINLAWRSEEISILKELMGKGYTDYEIGRRIGRPSGSVYVKRKRIILDDIKVRERG